MKKYILKLILLSFLSLNLLAEASVCSQSVLEMHTEIKKHLNHIASLKKQFDEESTNKSQKLEEYAIVYKKDMANYHMAKKAYDQDKTLQNQLKEKTAYNKLLKSKLSVITSTSENIDIYIKYVDDISNHINTLLSIIEKSKKFHLKNKLEKLEKEQYSIDSK